MLLGVGECDQQISYTSPRNEFYGSTNNIYSGTNQGSGGSGVGGTNARRFSVTSLLQLDNNATSTHSDGKFFFANFI